MEHDRRVAGRAPGDRADRGPAGGRATPSVLVERVPAQVVRALRHGVLRPGRPASQSSYPEDLDPATVHVAARHDGGRTGDVTGNVTGEVGAVVAVGTAIRQAPPWDPALGGAWRVRGMATAEAWRGRGLGTTVLGALVSAVSDAGATMVWCHARVAARRLYERTGFTARGDVFDLPDIGPHVVMWRTVGLCKPIEVAAPGTPGDAR